MEQQTKNLERKNKLRDISLNKTKKEVASVLQKCRAQNQNGLMEAFYKRAEEIYMEEKLTFENKMVIGSLCVHVPEELIYAFDAVPVRLCNGFYSMDQMGAEVLPTKVCPMVKAIAGSLTTEIFQVTPKPSLIINPTTCDQKKKISEAIPENKIPFYHLPMPSNKESEASQEYWQHTIADMIVELEKLTGKKLKKANLKQAIQKVSEAQKCYRELSQYRSEGLMSGTDMILISSLYFVDDIDLWIREVKKLIEALKEKKLTSNTKSRILLTGSPSIFPQLKLPLMIEELDALAVSDEFCSSNRLLYDTVAVDEWQLHDMIPALADKYLKPNTCPVFVPNDSRVRKIEQLIDLHQIDGIVYQIFTGCQPYDMETNRIRTLAEEKKIPFLAIETSYASDDKGQISTRIEAFIQSIKS